MLDSVIRFETITVSNEILLSWLPNVDKVPITDTGQSATTLIVLDFGNFVLLFSPDMYLVSRTLFLHWL